MNQLSPRRLAMICSLVALLAGSLRAQDRVSTAHDLGCITCHSTHDPKGPALFPANLANRTQKGTPLLGSAGMCYSCHKTETRGGRFFEPGMSHPTNVPVPQGMVVPRDLGTTLVKDLGEVITCTSCHDPHNRQPGFLKRPLEGDKLCVACHTMR